MSNKPTVQKSKEIFPTQTKRGGEKQPHGGVRQDKNAPERVRGASPQPVTPESPPRTHAANPTVTRGKKEHSRKRQKTYVMVWVDPGVKRTLATLARSKGLSLSATAGALLKQALQDETDRDTGTLLEPIIQQAVNREMHAYSSRLARLLVQALYATEHTKNLVTNVLARQPGVKREDLETILTASENSARSKIAVKDPQLAEIIEQVKTWLREVLTDQKRKN